MSSPATLPRIAESENANSTSYTVKSNPINPQLANQHPNLISTEQILEEIKAQGKRRLQFDGKVLFVGCGAIARAFLPLFFDLIDVPFHHVTFLDMRELEAVEPWNSYRLKGARFVRELIEEHTATQVLSKYLHKGDLMIDLAFGLDTATLIEWCQAEGVMLANTALYNWETVDASGDFSDHLQNLENTLFVETKEEVAKVDELNKKYGHQGASSVLMHGANPGIVNHFMKQGLVDIALKIIAEKPNDERIPMLEKALREGDFPTLALLEGVKVVQISERDTQMSRHERLPQQFLSTWNIQSFCEELSAPAEFAIGTHETKFITKPKSEGFHFYTDADDCNSALAVVMPTRGQCTWTRSYIPGHGGFSGMTIRHEECLTMADYLTIRDEHGRIVYRPSCYFTYRPECALESCNDFAANNFHLMEDSHILNDDIVEGGDLLGVYLGGHDFTGWWIGSLCSIHQVREMVGYEATATTIQVAAGLASAVCWIVEHKDQGIHLPETLPTNKILETCIPWLGTFVSLPLEWKPTPIRKKPGEPEKDTDDWTFIDFWMEEGNP